MVAEMRNISKRYGKNLPYVVSDISFTIGQGQTLGIYGDSGSGKSTIGQMLAGILKPTAGEIFYQGSCLSAPYKKDSRRRIQLLFQHPEVSFNPKIPLLYSMREPYRFFNIPYSESLLCEYLLPYGIYREHLGRRPAQLSGGELQRLALARVMLLEPRLIVLDEPTSMLDVISQAQVIHILKKLQREKGISYLFISHDRALCELFCDTLLHLRDARLEIT